MNEEYRVSYDIVAYHHSIGHHHFRVTPQPPPSLFFLQTVSRRNVKCQRHPYNVRTTRSLDRRGRSSHRPAHHGRMTSRPDSFYGLHFRQIHEKDDRVDTICCWDLGTAACLFFLLSIPMAPTDVFRFVCGGLALGESFLVWGFFAVIVGGGRVVSAAVPS